MRTYLLILAIAFISCGETKKPTLDTRPFSLPVPKGWTTESFSFPISFAPNIPFKGYEEIRFAKEWGDPQSEQHWAYAYLWWAEGQPVLTPDSLERYMMSYYNGLIRTNTADKQIPADKIMPTEVEVLSVAKDKNDLSTYQAEIRMFNYLVQAPIKLHSRIHIRYCPEAAHTAILIQISKHEFTHQIWEDLNLIGNEFACK